MKDYEQIVINKFPNLRYGEFKTVDNRQERFAIDDLSFGFPNREKDIQLAIESLVLSCRGFINVYSARDLAQTMNDRLEDLLVRLDPAKSLLIFPGNGAQKTKALIPEAIFKYFPTLDLEVKRILAPNMSVTEVAVLTNSTKIKSAQSSAIENFVLVDDVIASGTTAQSVRTALDRKLRYEWFAASWMMLSPLQVRNRSDDQLASSLLGYRQVLTSLVYQGESGIPANNSLSSFAEIDEKSESVISRYREKYAEDIGEFNKTIAILRGINDK